MALISAGPKSGNTRMMSTCWAARPSMSAICFWALPCASVWMTYLMVGHLLASSFSSASAVFRHELAKNPSESATRTGFVPHSVRISMTSV